MNHIIKTLAKHFIKLGVRMAKCNYRKIFQKRMTINPNKNQNFQCINKKQQNFIIAGNESNKDR